MDRDDLLPHMHRIQRVERDMRDLGLVWQMIESSAAISCPHEVHSILPTLRHTRERFEGLQQRLVEQLGSEQLAELGDDLVARAQCAIDILVRNLYERTADVGFLAMDEVLRGFCAAPADTQAAQRAAVAERLLQYRAKYSVYDDVIVLGTDGVVLARTDNAQPPLARSDDPLLAQALAAGGFVERFAATDLCGGARALVYAQRIELDGRAVGVLVLRFRFDDEMRRIFTALDDSRRQIALVLLDDEQRVVASNDEAHVPVGARLAVGEAGQLQLASFAGRDYLTVTCPTRGYQGYLGPGWRAQAMVSLLTAFRAGEAADAEHAIALDHAELAVIQGEADEINRNLRRVVWNGRLMAGSAQGDQARLKAVLTEVHRAGSRTRERLGHAIEELHRTSISRARQQAAERARLAADIMDRNLYERANDCRWWALSPALVEGLSAPPSAQSSARLSQVLDHINALYTVYARIVAFDADGCIRGASHEDEARPRIGTPVAPALRDAVARLATPQHYWASEFEPSELADGASTYVYAAAVRGAQGAFLGGVAIAFNAQRELAAMLTDVIGSARAGAAFVDERGHVLASSDPALALGAPLPFDADAAVVKHDAGHQACVRVRAAGYREFKHDDGYDNGVSAVVWVRLGSLERRFSALHDGTLLLPQGNARGNDTLELALFQVGNGRYALPAAAVIEAARRASLVRTPGVVDTALGLLPVESGGRRRLVQALCARRLFAVDYPARASDGVMVVLRSPLLPEQPAMALQVDDVNAVVEVDRARLQPAPAGLRAHSPWVESLLAVTTAQGETLVQVLDPAQLVAMIGVIAPVARADVGPDRARSSAQPVREDAAA